MMRILTLILGISCLVGFVYSNALPNVDTYNVEFEESTWNRHDDEELDQIVGGTAAAVGEFPYQARLSLSGRLCGGTLIRPSIVLTAAHCLAGLSTASTSTFRVLLNSTAINGGTPGAIIRNVRRFVMHSAYNSQNMDNDIALLALSLPVQNLTLARLPAKTCSPSTYANQTAVVAGWGTTSSGGSVSSTLLKATVQVLENTICNRQYGIINNNKLCAAAPGKDTCQGDSGGPLFVGGVQAGITSFGRGCADPRFAGVYARVTTYLDWIETTSASI